MGWRQTWWCRYLCIANEKENGGITKLGLYPSSWQKDCDCCKAVLLMRTRARPDKQVLSLGERWESGRGAFATPPGSQVDNLRVLLVDDVLTTGATLDACAQALREAGAKSVIGLTVARPSETPCQTPESGKIAREGAMGANRHMSVDSRGRYTPEVAGEVL